MVVALKKTKKQYSLKIVKSSIYCLGIAQLI